MYPRFAFALLFSVCAFGLGIAKPAFPTCPDNEEFQACGSACAPSCANPNPSPVCTKNCVVGCFCKQGHLRNTLGLCVPANECEGKSNMLFAYPPEMSQCDGDNEIFLTCGSACAPTCANPQPGPACTLQCVVGCFCKPGYLKNEQGVCVRATQCGASAPANLIMPLPPQVCGDNEVFRQCKGCDGTCDKPHPICPRICIAGCACKLGHVRTGPNGKCVPAEQCPKVNAAQMMMTGFLRPECGANMEWRTCGSACAATCANPHPSPACTKNCVMGCFCKDGFLKNANGECVAAANCDIPKPVSTNVMCATDREFYVDDCGTQMDCMATCNMPLPYMIHGHVQIPKVCLERKCGPSCVCKHPYVRNTDGECVERAACKPATTTAATTDAAH